MNTYMCIICFSKFNPKCIEDFWDGLNSFLILYFPVTELYIYSLTSTTKGILGEQVVMPSFQQL